MKALSLLTVLFFAPAALAVEAPAAQPVKVIVNGEPAVAAEGEAVVQLQAGDGEQDVRVMRFVTADGEEPEKFTVKVFNHASAAEVDPNRGWLGVALGESSDMEGVRIENVVKESPAEIAGLQTGDIVTAVNGEPLDGIAGLAGTIRELGPDSKVSFTVDREGQLLTLNATLASPPKEWNWTIAPDVHVRDHTKVGKVIMVTPDGVTLDDQGGPQGAWFNFHNLLADQVGSVTANVTIESGEKNISLVQEKDGQRLQVSQTGDGPIVVERDGVETEYADKAALEAGDAEAFELYDRHASHQGRMIVMPHGGNFSVNLDDGETFEWVTEELHETLRSHLQELDGLKDLGARIKMIQGLPGAGGGFGFMHASATRTFKVNPEGQIEVTIRKGDNEVIQVFRDEADLEARDPELFDKYAATLEADIDE